MLLGNIGASATTTLTIPFVPQALAFSNIQTITRVVVTVLGDGIIADYDAVSLANLKNTRVQGIVANYAEIMLANGIVKGKTCTIEVTNGVTAAVAFQTVYSDSGQASLYWGMSRQTVLAGSGTDFTKFGVLGLANSSSTDYAIVKFGDGAVQRFERDELRIMLAKFQCIENTLNDFKIDNIDGWISTVTFYPTTSQLVFIQKWLPVGSLVEGAF